MAYQYKGKRSRNIYQKGQDSPFKLSRTRIENYLRCRRCFYIDRRLGVDQPPGFPFNLNSAVDTLLKKEFDLLREEAKPHELFSEYGIDAVPFSHPKLDEWRENFKGVCTLHEETNLEICGAVDDIWVGPDGALIVVDYKSTSKEGEVTLDASWQIGYKRQMEIYQWLLRENGFEVSDTGYFVYVNGRTDLATFDGRLEFDIRILPYKGTTAWVSGTLRDIKNTLDSDEIPEENPLCDYCTYRQSVLRVTAHHLKKKRS